MDPQKENIKKIQENLRSFLEEYGDILSNRCRYDNNSAKFTIELSLLNKQTEDLQWFDGTNEEVKLGFARPGTKVMKEGIPVKILKRRRTKYLYEYLEGHRKGLQYICNFAAFKIR